MGRVREGNRRGNDGTPARPPRKEDYRAYGLEDLENLPSLFRSPDDDKRKADLRNLIEAARGKDAHAERLAFAVTTARALATRLFGPLAHFVTVSEEIVDRSRALGNDPPMWAAEAIKLRELPRVLESIADGSDAFVARARPPHRLGKPHLAELVRTMHRKYNIAYPTIRRDLIYCGVLDSEFTVAQIRDLDRKQSGPGRK